MMPVWIKERAKSLKTNLKKNTYKGDNRYLSFHERLCRFNQNKINRIIESASDELINTNSRREELEVFFQISVLIKYLRRSLSSVQLQGYNSFTKAELVHRVFAEHLFRYQRLSISWLLVAPSETNEIKHKYQIRKRDSFSLVSKNY